MSLGRKFCQLLIIACQQTNDQATSTAAEKTGLRAQGGGEGAQSC